jgi:hypothetical protein
MQKTVFPFSGTLFKGVPYMIRFARKLYYVLTHIIGRPGAKTSVLDTHTHARACARAHTHTQRTVMSNVLRINAFPDKNIMSVERNNCFFLFSYYRIPRLSE